MSLSDDIKTALEANAPLVALLTGGIHNEVEEINRQLTPTAFDANKEIEPCALIKLGTEFKLSKTSRGVRTPIAIYFYEREGYASIDAAIDIVFNLMNDAKIGNNVWNIEYQNTVYQQRDQALDCPLGTLRFVAARLR